MIKSIYVTGTLSVQHAITKMLMFPNGPAYARRVTQRLKDDDAPPVVETDRERERLVSEPETSRRSLASLGSGSRTGFGAGSSGRDVTLFSLSLLESLPLF